MVQQPVFCKFKTCSSPQNNPHIRYSKSLPMPSSPHYLAASNPLPVSVGLPFLESPYERNHTICDFLWLPSFAFKVHPYCSRCQNFLPFKAESYSTVGLDNILLMHSSIDGCLGCFHLLAISENAEVSNGCTNICSCPCFQFLCVDAQKRDFWIIW